MLCWGHRGQTHRIEVSLMPSTHCTILCSLTNSGARQQKKTNWRQIDVLSGLANRHSMVMCELSTTRSKWLADVCQISSRLNIWTCRRAHREWVDYYVNDVDALQPRWHRLSGNPRNPGVQQHVYRVISRVTSCVCFRDKTYFGDQRHPLRISPGEGLCNVWPPVAD